MRKWPLSFLAIAPLTAAAADPGLVAAYGQLRNASLDATRIAVAENLVLKGVVLSSSSTTGPSTRWSRSSVRWLALSLSAKVSFPFNLRASWNKNTSPV